MNTDQALRELGERRAQALGIAVAEVMAARCGLVILDARIGAPAARRPFG